MLEHVAAAVDTRPLAIPHGEDPVDVCTLVQVDLLRAPDGRRGEILVESGLELHVRSVQELLGLPQRLVEAAKRRAAIAGHEASGLQPGLRIALPLQDQQPDERLHAGEEDAAGSELELVVERDVAKGWRAYRAGDGHRQSSKNRVPDVAATCVRGRIR